MITTPNPLGLGDADSLGLTVLTGEACATRRHILMPRCGQPTDQSVRTGASLGHQLPKVISQRRLTTQICSRTAKADRAPERITLE
jgi:hypothetical protein